MTALPIADASGRIERFRRQGQQDIQLGSIVTISPIGTRYRVVDLFVNEGNRAMAVCREEGASLSVRFPVDRLTLVPAPARSIWPAFVILLLVAVLLGGWWALS